MTTVEEGVPICEQLSDHALTLSFKITSVHPRQRFLRETKLFAGYVWFQFYLNDAFESVAGTHAEDLHFSRGVGRHTKILRCKKNDEVALLNGSSDWLVVRSAFSNLWANELAESFPFSLDCIPEFRDVIVEEDSALSRLGSVCDVCSLQSVRDLVHKVFVFRGIA
jgi:hypothetical protein